MTVLAKLGAGVLTGVAMAVVLGAAGAHGQVAPPPAPSPTQQQAVYPQAAPPAQVVPLTVLDPRAARLAARYERQREKLALRQAREREKLAAVEQHKREAQAAQAAQAAHAAQAAETARARGYARDFEAGEQARIAAVVERERRRAAKLAERAARVEAVRIERERRLEARERERAARLAYARERGHLR
jgi:hypothetical protein